ncbi:MAG: ImmA/IrrE family metallo-endopeptidase [Bermanella sp.]
MNVFSPDWVSPPGDSISQLMKRKNKNVNTLSSVTGFSEEKINSILSGKEKINIKFAQSISKELGGSVEFWLKREKDYRENNIRIISSFKDWVDSFPYSDLAKYGWVDATSNVLERYHNLLDYFSSDSIDEWDSRYMGLLSETSYRVSNSFDSDSYSVVAWLTKAKRELNEKALGVWDSKNLEGRLQEIKALTRKKDPEVFIPELEKILNEVGVSLSIIPTPKGCSLSGATFKSEIGNPIILLSSRYLSDDQFWFTLFHEIGHVLLHGDRELILEGGMVDEIIEKEADEFSSLQLIPLNYIDELNKITVRDWKKIPRLAKKIGVSSGVVLGQLQHRGVIPVSHLNKLKVRYKWNRDNRLTLKD